MIPKLPKRPVKPLKAQSSNVAGFVHDDASHDLDVTFHGGRVYRYQNVPVEKFKALQSAPSKGTYINEHVIPHHTFTRIR